MKENDSCRTHEQVKSLAVDILRVANVMKGLKGLVDGEHYYGAIAEDAQFEFLYRFSGWPKVIPGREKLIAAYSGTATTSFLKKVTALWSTMARNLVWSLWNIRFMGKPSKPALCMTTDSRPSSPSKIERLFAGEITWIVLPHGRRSSANENGVEVEPAIIH